MTRQDRVDELRDDGFVEPDDAGEERLAGLQLPHEVVANFLLDRARLHPGSTQITEGLNWGNHETDSISVRRPRDYTTSPLSHPFFTARRPQVFAHRGGSALAPENTIAAFDRGLALGADGLELDVHLSRDGVVVVHHDRTLERTTNLTGPVASRTADELARADAGYSFRRVQRTRPSTTAGLRIRRRTFRFEAAALTSRLWRPCSSDTATCRSSSS